MRPLVGVPLPGRHQPGNCPSRNGSARLNQHLQVEAVGKPPLNLANRVPGRVSMILLVGAVAVAMKADLL